MMKLGKLLKKMQSITKTKNRVNDTRGSNSNRSNSSSSEFSDSSWSNNLCPVYVGKSRRRYLVGSDVVGQPLFREMAERGGEVGGDEITVVGCEVVMFEHLSWMLENGDAQLESLDELVDYYAC